MDEDTYDINSILGIEKKPQSIKAIIDEYREQYRVIYMKFRTSTRDDRHQIANFELSQVLFEMNLSLLFILQSADLDPKQYV
ncbi:hypothetical protein X762_21540 [Mesorhizobium sp. LSHC426A00]|nr:hypothetical protein X762_21540 [Mesorhizobium sp. LSHC426A00]ESX54459.1 hypothetical protein X761_16700 [Mesorhizobium sp. LSHC424B00]ESX72372.1 hypothetical protein X758_14720 [Mesorhizobium sp. LSHC416B00]